MDIMELGAIGELVGGVAVLVTLIYLAVQMRDARRLLDEQSVATGAATLYTAFDPVYRAGNAPIFRRGIQGDPLNDPDEAYIFEMLMYRQAGAVTMLARAGGTVGQQNLSGLNDLVFERPGAARWLRSLPEGPFKASVIKAPGEIPKSSPG